MAAICAPERPVVGAMPIAIHDGASNDLTPRFNMADDAPTSASRSRDGPPPNPPFSFPALPSPSSAPPSFSRQTGRRPQSAIEVPSPGFQLGSGNPHDRSPARMALPAFSFNPGATLPTEPVSSMLLSPPTSPDNPNRVGGASLQRPGGFGHRRGGSEFVGGRLRDGNSIAVMGTSPTKSESGFASPTFQPPRRPHRRGHSRAISSNDIPLMPSPPAMNNDLLHGSSAPNSPTNFQEAEFVPMTLPDMLPTPPEPKDTDVRTEELSAQAPVTEMDVAAVEEPLKNKPVSRARVGFSDTLEFIPRPLSLATSDTSSTMTARPGHSVTGSMSSLISLSSPQDHVPSPLSRSPTRDDEESRPSTAGAILERTLAGTASTQPKAPARRRSSIPELSQFHEEPSAVALPLPSPTKTPKRWSFFGLDSFASSSSPTKARRNSSSSSDSEPRAVSVGSSSEHGSESIGEGSESATGKSRKQQKMAKKEKKKKTTRKRASAWAESILPRKSKSDSKQNKIAERPPTPPPTEHLSDEEEDDDLTPQPEPSPVPQLLITESQPEAVAAPRQSDEPSTPMIDLDAALGPFNTPLAHNPEWEAAQRAAGNVGKRRLHSAQGLKGFSGPGMHYHRRAESAPDLPPFEAGRNGIHRFGSSSTMADVFEEDEEDEAAGKGKQKQNAARNEKVFDSESEMASPEIAQKDSVPELQESLVPRIRRQSSGLSDKERPAASIHSVRAERSKTSLHDSAIIEDTPSIIFRSANMFQGRPDSAHSAATSHRKCSGGKELSPVDIGPLHSSHGNAPLSPYAVSLASSYPSPRSPMSVDAQRISTAPSSVHDENNFQSLLLGEPGPEVRISMDYDIPSLTSSTSTMTRDSAFTGPSPRLPKPSRGEARPMSMGSTAFGRRRSSLVSLSRLISSSHGERSKLSMEVTLDDPDQKRKKHKNSKSKTFGRLMTFWRPSKDNPGES